MSLNDFFQFFVTKEKKFYPLFIKQAETIDTAAKCLRQMVVAKDDELLDKLKKEIKFQETSGDEILKDFNSQLYATFLTPFERNDVNDLAELTDNLLDLIDDSSNIIYTRRVEEIDDDIIKMTDNISKSADELLAIMQGLEFISTKQGADIARRCHEIKMIEHDCDEIFGNYISRLFSENTDFIDIIKKEDLMMVLENTMNSAKYISDKVRSLQAKLS